MINEIDKMYNTEAPGGGVLFLLLVGINKIPTVMNEKEERIYRILIMYNVCIWDGY